MTTNKRIFKKNEPTKLPDGFYIKKSTDLAVIDFFYVQNEMEGEATSSAEVFSSVAIPSHMLKNLIKQLNSIMIDENEKEL